MTADVSASGSGPTGFTYQIHPDHRNGTPGKSQWIIPATDEVKSFEQAVALGCIDFKSGWGLHCPNGIPESLGRTTTQHEVKIAKFVENLMPVFWHGYPADYRRKPQDRCPVSVLQTWHTVGYIEKYEIARVRSGKRCSLSSS
ncbi:MAG: hypothetical protein JW384_02666 [Nitrosomonadaceae bacterium]|nr:hypothetical protein [Nitrosomonadaceae bacterium]